MGELRENQKVKIFFKTAEKAEQHLECSIKSFFTDRIALNYPKEIHFYLDYLQEGEEIKVNVFTNFGVLEFKSVILYSPAEGDFIIEFVPNHINIQRRKYIRTKISTKIIILRDRKDNIVTQTADMSGSGVRFIYEGTFAPNETVSCLLYLPREIRSVKAKGIIVKKDHLRLHEHILLFTLINEVEREYVNQRCLQLQTNSYLEEQEQKAE